MFKAALRFVPGPCNAAGALGYARAAGEPARDRALGYPRGAFFVVLSLRYLRTVALAALRAVGG